MRSTQPEFSAPFRSLTMHQRSVTLSKTIATVTTSHIISRRRMTHTSPIPQSLLRRALTAPAVTCGNEGDAVGDRIVRLTSDGFIKQPTTTPKYYICVIQTLK